ncbi:MAG: TolC family protein [Alistipes sp.]
MKKIIILCVAVALSSCGIYKPYTRPEVRTDGLYGQGVETMDSLTLGDVRWQEMFTDPLLQQLIEQGLANNTDLQSAQWRVKEAEAALKVSRLSFLPSFNFAPQGSVSSFDNGKASWTYNVPITASWEIDIFARLLNGKRKAKAVYAQSQEYRQAVQTQLISGIANLYYSLLMLDSQYATTKETATKWRESVETMKSLKQAGMTNEAAVAQTEANCLAIEASLYNLQYNIREVENSLASLLGDVPHNIERGLLSAQVLPQDLNVGIPIQMLANRPDVKSAELALTQSYYATSEARSSLYPSLKLSGSAGWTNAAGSYVVNPGKLLLSAAGSLLQPIFNAGANRAKLKIAKAQQEESKLSFQQTLLNAGAEVNNALTQCQTARSKSDLRIRQIAALETAVESTQLLMRHGSSTYLEVLTAQQALLSAQLSQISDHFDAIQGTVNLYQALGGGRDIPDPATEKTEKTKKTKKR